MFVIAAIISLLYISKISCTEVVVPGTYAVQHAEGPLWDPIEQALYYVDTFTATIIRWQPSGNKITFHKLDGNSVGFIVPIQNRYKEFVVCRDRRVDLFSWDGAHNNSGTLKQLAFVDQNKTNNQFNDGKADSRGRLWGGTLTRNEDLSVSPNGGSLYKISKSNLAAPDVILSSVSISNGLAWSSDNKKFFYIDSETRQVVKYTYNSYRGTITSPQTLFDLEQYPHLQGIPDGMTIDRNDNLWVALYGGKSVIKIDSTSGKLLRTVKIPATYVTSVTFGGLGYNILYVTTSKLKLSAEQQDDEPYAGRVFAVYELGVKGYRANEVRL